MAAVGEEEVEYESDPEEAKRSLAMRRREASDDEEGNGDGEDDKPRMDRRATIHSDESDGQGAAADYDDEELDMEDEDYEEIYDEEEEEEEEDENDEEEVDEGKEGMERNDERASAGGAEATMVAATREPEGDGIRSLKESVDGRVGNNVAEESEKKENEPFAVPTAGAFYMHDDRFRDNAGGRHRRTHGGRKLWESKDDRKWGHDKFEEMSLQERQYEEGRRSSRGRYRARGKNRGPDHGYPRGNRSKAFNGNNNHNQPPKGSVRGRGPRRYEHATKNSGQSLPTHNKQFGKALEKISQTSSARAFTPTTNAESVPIPPTKQVFASNLSSASPPFYPSGSSNKDVTLCLPSPLLLNFLGKKEKIQMGLLGFQMITRQNLGFLCFERWRLGFVFRVVFGLWVWFVLSWPVTGVRPIRERARSWGDEWLFVRKDENELGPFSPWNITGTYRGIWKFLDSTNSSSRFPDFRKSNGNSIIELVSTPTKITGVHYVQGVIIFHDVFDNEHNVGGAQIRVEGVYIWPFRQLRLVANSGKDGELSQEDDYILSNPYHLLGVFSSQVFQDSPRDKLWRRKNSPIYEMEKHCNIEIAAQISRAASTQNDGDHDRYHIEGLMESPAVDDDGDCFSPLLLNTTSVNIEVYYNKAVNYTLMVTFVSFLQVLLLIRQMEHSNTQSGAAKVSIIMVGQQAIMDAYLCLLHLTAGILVESLFNAFATAAFFKFVVFSIFEMRYLLAIWKASRPMNNGEGWETMRRELSFLYSRFYGILLGGILFMYEFHNYLRPILLLMYSFWIPQIITNVIRDSRKPLHPYYILGMSVTRLAIPLYIFGCPNNFMRIEPDNGWCVCLGVFIGLQASILLLQHYLGSRWFIPRQILPEKYSYYRRFDQDTDHATDCVICMTAIDITQRSNDCMVTPCDHFFHSGCLQRWMDIKMECPTCRRPLPPA